MMRIVSYTNERRNAARRSWWGLCSFLGVLFMAGLVFGQPQPATGEKNAPQQARTKKAIPKDKLKRTGNTLAGRKKPRRQPLQMNPNAKWACDQTTTTLEPIWRGPKGVVCSFEIRNEGTGVLQIKAKGG